MRVALRLRSMNQVIEYLVELRKSQEMRTRLDSKDAILALDGLGRGVWKGVDPDDYVRDLREGW